MDVLSCQISDRIDKEIQLCLLAYNLFRNVWHIVQSGFASHTLDLTFDPVFKGSSHHDITDTGPQPIPEFWEHGARFVFFEGPEGWPLEFYARLEVKRSSDRTGHDHYGIRTSDIENSQREWVNRGAVLIAEHQLTNAGSIVNVRFPQLAEVTIELFDEAPVNQTPREGGWIGVLET